MSRRWTVCLSYASALICSLSLLAGCGKDGDSTSARGVTQNHAEPSAAHLDQARQIQDCLHEAGIRGVSHRERPGVIPIRTADQEVFTGAYTAAGVFGISIRKDSRDARESLGSELDGAGGSEFLGIFSGSVVFTWPSFPTRALEAARPKIAACAFSVPAAGRHRPFPFSFTDPPRPLSAGGSRGCGDLGYLSDRPGPPGLAFAARAENVRCDGAFAIVRAAIPPCGPRKIDSVSTCRIGGYLCQRGTESPADSIQVVCQKGSRRVSWLWAS